MAEPLLTDAQLAEMQRRRPGGIASLACEGMHVTPEDLSLFEQMDAERLGPEARFQRIVALARQEERQHQVAAAVG